MALNLNKSGEKNKEPAQEKKGLNLSKSVDPTKIQPNLKKIQTTSSKQKAGKKKSLVLFIFFAIALLCIVGFWYMNDTVNETPITTLNNNGKSDEVETQVQNEQTHPTSNISKNITSNEPLETNATSNELERTNTITENSANSVTSNSSIIQSNSISEPMSETVVFLQGSMDENVAKVIRGDFGNGKDRKNALGTEYDLIQSKVNEIFKTN